MPEQRTVIADEADIRLDRWFKRHYPDLSHGALEKLLRTGQVRVDGKRAKSNQRLAAGQMLRVPPMAASSTTMAAARPQRAGVAKQLQSWILHQDDDVIVLNKPPGLAVQGGTGISRHLDAMLGALSHQNGEKPKLTHRLDRETSGVLILARNAFAASKLTASFRNRDTEKIYWAVTIGVPRVHQGRIDLPLKKQGEIMVPTNQKDAEGKSASTLYTVTDIAGKQAAFVALWPLTGRTHQLRVHLAQIGTPILGDETYDGAIPEPLREVEIYQGMHLHARRLVIPHPRRGMIDIIAPLSPQMQKTWKWYNFSTEDSDWFAEFKA